jgi:glutaredoxin
MGRITIFTTEGCSASIRTMAALKSRKLPFSDINLTDHPSKRSDVLKICHRYSTPQVFFNTRYIGGFEATIALLNEWALTCEGTNDSCSLTGSSTVSSYSLESAGGKDKRSKNKSQPILYASMHDRYMAEIGNHHDPSDPRLSIPAKVAIGNKDTFIRDESKQNFIKLPSEDQSSVLEMTVMLLDILRHVDHNVGSTTYKHSFTGRELIKAICAVFEISKDEASKFCNKLLSIGIFALMGNASNENKTADISSQAVYRMKCLETPNILNSFCDWTEKVDQNYMRLITRLTNIMNTIQIDATDRYGTIRRERAIKHSSFPMFEEAICEIQGVHLTQMNDSTKIVRTTNFFLRNIAKGG